VLARPIHPYTRGLLASQPGFALPGSLLSTIRGMVPPLTRLPAGCRFRDRCDFAEPACAQNDPRLSPVGDGHAVACPVLAGRESEAG